MSQATVTPPAILVVEDEILLSETVKQSLERYGFRVVGQCPSAEEALELLARLPTAPDLVLMDIRLDGPMDGIEAAGIVAQHYDSAIVFMTGFNEPYVFERAFATKPHAYLVKPFDEEQAKATIQIALYQRKLELELKKRQADLEQLNADLEQRVAERTRELRAGEEKFRTVADFTHDWEIWFGPRQELLYMSPSCHEVTGYTAAEFSADPGLVARIIHPDDREAYVRLQQRGESDHTAPPPLELRILRKNGDECWLEYRGLPVFGTDNQWLGVRASLRDITERKNAQVAIEDRLLALTQPTGEIGDFHLRDVVPLGMLQRLQDQSAAFFNVACVMCDNAGQFITQPSRLPPTCHVVRSSPEGREFCQACCREYGRQALQKHPGVLRGCVLDGIQCGVIPIRILTRHVGTWIIGHSGDAGLNESLLPTLAADLKVPQERLLAAVRDLPNLAPDHLQRILQYLDVLVHQVTVLGLQNLMQARYLGKLRTTEQQLQRAVAERDQALRRLETETKPA